MDPKVQLDASTGDLLPDAFVYRRLIDRLLYLTISRLDITFAFHKLSQFLSQPRVPHLNATHHLLCYLKNSPSQGLFYSSSSTLKLTAFSDADSTTCPDTCKSVSGFCIFLGDFLVSWKSKKQTTISRSSTEAEYRALATSTIVLIWIKQLLHDFGLNLFLPDLLFCDNKAAIHNATNPIFHERTKHIEIN